MASPICVLSGLYGWDTSMIAMMWTVGVDMGNLESWKQAKWLGSKCKAWHYPSVGKVDLVTGDMKGIPTGFYIVMKLRISLINNSVFSILFLFFIFSSIFSSIFLPLSFHFSPFPFPCHCHDPLSWLREV